MIDDPVQAMDPAKVDGLANVLHRAARTRQIVVFTHDDRLPEAIRRLRLDATMLHVDRRARSAVAVQTSRSPVQRYLDGARGYARSDRLPPEVQARVVPMFCRNAVEAAAANLDPPPRRRRRHRPPAKPTSRSPRPAACGRRSRSCCSATPAARARSAARSSAATARTAATLVTELNKGAHGNVLDPETLQRLPEATRNLITDLSRVSLSVKHVLDEAERQLDEFDPHTSGAWPHAAAALIRQCLESTLDVFWRTKAPGMLETPPPATSGSACPPSSATSRRPAPPTSPGARSPTPATTAPTTSASRRTSCAPTWPRRASFLTRRRR